MGTKKIRFPLEMRNGEKVHTLEELKENFDIGRILEYAAGGQLVKWLRDRGADDMAGEIAALDKESADYGKRICEAILGEADETLLGQIEAEKSRKERERIQANQEAQRRKIEMERAEGKAAEEKRKEEERKRQETTGVILYNGRIYIAEGSRLVRCKTAAVSHMGFVTPGYSTCEVIKPNVVLEGDKIYYMKKIGPSWRSLKCFLYRMDWETGEERQLCEIDEYVILRGVKKNKLFYGKRYSSPMGEDISGEDIYELDLDTMREKVHKLKASSKKGFGFQGELYIEEGGKHIYGPLHSFSPNEAYIADVDLEKDRISKLIPLSVQQGNYDAHFARTGHGFVAHDYVRKVLEEKITYYNAETKQMVRLGKLEEIYAPYDGSMHFMYGMEMKQMCGCGEHVYLMAMKSRELVITEYDIASGESVERVHLKDGDIALKSRLKDSILHFYIGGSYLYMINFWGYNQLWRFSMHDWVPELVIDGEEDLG